MKKSILVDKKLLIPAILVATGLMATYLVATPALAVLGQQIMGNSTMSKITGSVNVAEAIKNFTKTNQKVPFSEAAELLKNRLPMGKYWADTLGYRRDFWSTRFLL